MFTGLVERAGSVVGVSNIGAEKDLDIDLALPEGSVRIGDSVALSGVCCTVVQIDGGTARFRLSEETIRRTWFGRIEAGDRVNIERALRMGDPLGGHMVQGHVDAVGEVTGRIHPQDGGELWIRVPESLAPYCVEKGSISIDGVSLTIAAMVEDRIMIAIIPHTAQVTTLGELPEGKPVNLEADVIGKYVERMLQTRFAKDA